MLKFDFNRAKSAVEEVKQALEGVRHVAQEVTPVAQQVKFVIPEGATLAHLLGEMIGLQGTGSLNHHRMGQLYNYAVERKLAEQEGYKDAATYFQQKLADLSSATLRTYGSVAKNFSEPVAVRFGVTCLYLLLSYEEAADLKVNHEEPGPTVIEVPDPNGAVTPKLFSACTVEDMRKALKLKRKPTSSKPVPAEDVALADVYREALKGLFTQGSDVKLLVRNEKGTTVVDFKNVPLREVATLILALMDHLPPGSELRRG